MCEIPNNVVLAAEPSELFDGSSIGSPVRRAGSIALGDNGRRYANMTPTFAPSDPPFQWPFLFAFDP